MNNNQISDLGKGERLILWLPLIGGAAFGILPLFPPFFAALFGFSGNDPFIYQLAGAATFGYVIPLWCAISGKVSWKEIKLVIVATLTFNIVSLYACISAIVAGNAQWVVYAILLVSIGIIAITSSLLKKHMSASESVRDVRSGAIIFLKIATFAALVFGVLPLFSKFSAPLFGYLGTDKLLYDQAGAATLGYVVMGILEIRSRNFTEIRLPVLMAGIFNGVSFVVSVYQIIVGNGSLLVYLIAPASLAFTIGLAKIYKKSALA